MGPTIGGVNDIDKTIDDFSIRIIILERYFHSHFFTTCFIFPGAINIKNTVDDILPHVEVFNQRFNAVFVIEMLGDVGVAKDDGSADVPFTHNGIIGSYRVKLPILNEVNTINFVIRRGNGRWFSNKDDSSGFMIKVEPNVSKTILEESIDPFNLKELEEFSNSFNPRTDKISRE